MVIQLGSGTPGVRGMVANIVRNMVSDNNGGHRKQLTELDGKQFLPPRYSSADRFPAVPAQCVSSAPPLSTSSLRSPVIGCACADCKFRAFFLRIVPPLTGSRMCSGCESHTLSPCCRSAHRFAAMPAQFVSAMPSLSPHPPSAHRFSAMLAQHVSDTPSLCAIPPLTGSRPCLRSV